VVDRLWIDAAQAQTILKLPELLLARAAVAKTQAAPETQVQEKNEDGG
jgi:hypothetical protein